MPQTILVFLFGDLGDTVLTVPAVRSIRQRYPAARVVLVGKAVAAEFLTGLGVVDEAIEVDKHAFDRISSLANPVAVLRLAHLLVRLRRERADTVVLFHHLVTRWGALKFALLALASGAWTRIGLDNGRGWFLTARVRDRGFGARHEAEYWMEVVSLLDARGELALSAPISAQDRRRACELLAGVGPPARTLIGIHAGTGWYGPGRLWHASGFARAAELILADAPAVHFLILGTDSDRHASAPVLDRLGRNANDLVDRTSVGELAAVLQRCALVLANDGGVAQLASAVGTPVVTVFGPSNDAAWRPLNSTVVSADLPCRPCFYRGFERGLPRGCATRECLDLVTPASVARAACAILRARNDGNLALCTSR
jgi:heptosyltransferase-2